MRKLYMLLLFFSCFQYSFPQKKDTLIKYFNTAFDPCKKSEAVYAGVAVKEGLGWSVAAFNDSGKIVMRGFYKDKQLATKHGWFVYYYSHGQRMMASKYENNIPEGNWQTWYSNGQLKDSITFKKGLRDGPSVSFFETGKIKCTGIFSNNAADSNWAWYHENGNIATEEVFSAGRLKDLKCYDSNGKFTGIMCSLEKEPAIKGYYGGIRKYIKDSLLYPVEAWRRGLEGIVDVEFTVTKEGKTENTKITYSSNELFTTEVIRLINSVPGWYPAIEHNRIIDYKVTLKIPFYKKNEEE